MSRATPSNIGDEIIRRLEEFTRDLEAGVPIEAVQIQRHETPDGPMHVRRRVVIDTKGGATRDE